MSWAGHGQVAVQLPRYWELLGWASCGSGGKAVLPQTERELLKLTSASITPHIQTLVRQGKLVAFEPELDPDQGHCRCIWMHPQVAQWVARAGLGTSGNDYYA